MSDPIASDHVEDGIAVRDRPMEVATPAAYAALDLALRRQLLRDRHDVYSPQSHLDAAEIASATGLPDAAKLLSTLAFLRVGCSPVAVRHHMAIARRFGLPRDKAVPHSSPSARFTVATALDELRQLLDGPDDAPPSDGVDNGHVPGSPTTRLTDVVLDCEALRRLLRSPGTEADLAELGAVWARLSDDYARYTPAALAAHASDPLGELVEAFARSSLRAFIRDVHPLAAPPFGSTRLLHGAARLDPAGLGAFFGNMSCLIRSPLDLLGLIRAAAGDAADGEVLERWVVILSTGLNDHDLPGLVDVLGDLRLSQALRGILGLAKRPPEDRPDHHLMFTLRDAGLDIRDLWLASEAQRIVAIDRATVALEWRILGDIHATAGEIGLAREAFLHGLRFDPNDESIASRLAAVDAGAFAPFAIQHGFGERSRARRGGALDRGRKNA